jgi:NAD(P)-dependent dehydrogenase (short-subunit alcohol dehydrogenase family)
MASTTTAAAAAAAATVITGKKLCIVVGLGRGGIGDSVAKKFSNEGYNVAMIARSNLSQLEQSIPNSKSYQCDVSVPTQITDTITAIINDNKDRPYIDALLYNAGSGVFKTFHDTTYNEYEIAWKTGPCGLFCFTKECLPYMPINQNSCIGITGATASWRGMPYTAAFASSKMATRGLAQSLARDIGPSSGIHVFHVVIDSIVKLPTTTGKADNEILDPTMIAETYYQLSQQSPTCWTQEIHLSAQGSFGSIASI